MKLGYEEYLKLLREKSLLPGFVTPYYEGLSIVNLTSSLYRILGISTPANVKPLKYLDRLDEEFDAVLLFLVDALGFYDFVNSIDRRLHKEIKNLFSIYPITTVAPSTTTTALASLYTGLPPNKHGLVGYRIYFKEFGLIVKIIEYSPIVGGFRDSLGFEDIDPKDILPHPLIFENAENSGLKSFVAIKKQYQDSMFTRLLIGETRVIPFIEMEDMFLKIIEKVKRGRGQLFIHAYWNNLDILGHEYGPNSPVYGEHISRFFEYFVKFVRKILKIKKKIHILLTGDHGHVQVDPRKPFIVKKEDEIFETLALPPYGDSRFTYFKTDDKDAFLSLAKKSFPKSFRLYESIYLNKLGLFGQGTENKEFLERIGDFIAIPQDNSYLVYPFTRNYKETMRGRHSGLSEREMIIPLLSLKY